MHRTFSNSLGWRHALLVLLMTTPCAAIAAPGDILFSDNFDDGTLAPWTTTDASRSGVLSGAGVAASGYGAYTRNDAVAVTSPVFFAAVPFARLDIWVRRGADAFSEDPDNGDDLYIEYQRADSSWGLLGTYSGIGQPGEVFNDSFNLPPDGLHGALAIRARQLAGSGFDWDYWHFDNVVVTEVASAGPLGVGGCDDFESGLSNWTVSSAGGFAGINSATSSSPSNAMYLNGGVVDVESIVVDTSDVSFSDLTVWIRRGADSFSEDPDPGENLIIEYLDDLGAWVVLETFTGAGQPGQILPRTYNLPAAGRHAGFRLRFRQTGGGGAASDFWHVDDVCFVQEPVPVLLVSKIGQTVSDPVNGTNNPKAIPGAVVQYTIAVSNQGTGTVDSGSLIITDPLPANLAMYVDTSGGDPVVFIDGPAASGLSFTYATDVSYSNQAGGGPPYTYLPTPDAQGFDPAVTGVRINPTGVMNATAGTTVPSFNIRFQVRIE